MSELRFCVRSDKRESFSLSLDGKGREGEERRRHSLWGTIAHDRDARFQSSNQEMGQTNTKSCIGSNLNILYSRNKIYKVAILSERKMTL